MYSLRINAFIYFDNVNTHRGNLKFCIYLFITFKKKVISTLPSDIKKEKNKITNPA